MSVEAFIVNITPKGAQKFLDEEPDGQPNRAVNQGHVAWLAKQMKDGSWKLNGESIIVGSNHALLDGRHRLHAVIQSGVTIRTLLIRGVDPLLFHTIDTGKQRGVADILTIAGFKHSKVQATVARMLFRLREKPDSIFHSDSGRGEKVTGAEAIEVLDRHPRVAQIAHEASRYARLGRPSLLVFVRYLTMLIDEEKSDSFFTALEKGEDLKVGHPAHTLRERLANARAVPSMQLTETAFAALVIKAWNSYYRGGRLSTLKYCKSDPFPTIAGLTKSIINGQEPQ